MKLFSFLVCFCIFSHFPELNAQVYRDSARAFVDKQLKAQNFDIRDFEDAVCNDDFSSGRFRYIYYQQVYRGVKVFNAILNVVVPPSGKTLINANRFVPQFFSKVKGQKVQVAPNEAVRLAFFHLSINIQEELDVITDEKSEDKGSLARKIIYKSTGGAEDDISSELVWAVSDEQVELAWNVRIKLRNDWWEIRVSALNGEILEKNNWVSHCNFDIPIADCRNSLPEITEHQAVQETNDYQVFDIPLASPVAGERVIVNSPWEKAGSGNPAVTLQWHNDGTKTYNTTRGNNVYAKEDVAGDNELTIGYSPVSPAMDFSFPFTLGAAANVNRDAAITNLFYWNNLCHDIFYQYGFDEPSGNFQKNNLGRGGAGNDFVYADAMDGSGTNNANFSTPPDGSAPRMQMFLWNASAASSMLKVNSPSNIAGDYAASAALFNPSTPESVTADLVMASPVNACGALTNTSAVAGKIVVINRGDCTFVTKVKNAQNAGAKGVVIINNVAGNPISMGGTDNTINILSCMISNTNGAIITNGIQAGTVNATIKASQSGGNSIDGDFDNGVIVHEYGHGVSTRLTGGRTTSSCLSNAEQMGEGWSDYFSLMLCTDWTTAKASDARAIGNYVIGQNITGGGIRNFPYSYDMSISPYNYNFARANTAVHDLGSAWASMLWDMTWSIIEMVPASPDIYHGTGGNNIALALVMEGLKLQPCNPGFVDGRDAILKADELLYDGAYSCAIWKAFARRGLGLGASQGSRNSASDGNQAFDAPQGLTLKVIPSKDIVAPGDTVDFTLTTRCDCSENKRLQLNATLSSKLDYLSSSGTFSSIDRTVSFNTFDLLASEQNNQLIRAVVNGSFSQPVILFQDDAENGADKWTSVHLSGAGNPQFTIGTQNVRSGSNAWFIPATTQQSQTAMTLNEPLLLSENSWMSFWHSHSIEPEYDGGVVEISTDNGVLWQDLGSRMTRNGYNGKIAITDNTLQGRDAFFGEVPLRQTVINLSDFSGQEVLIRFRYGTDTQNGALPTATGWFIDDIQVTYNDTCILLNANVSNTINAASDFVCLSVEAVEPLITSSANTESPYFSIYPNPTHDNVMISNMYNKRVLARLFTVTGQEMQSMFIDASSKDAFNLSAYPPALYLLELNSGSEKQMFRIIKY